MDEPHGAWRPDRSRCASNIRARRAGFRSLVKGFDTYWKNLPDYVLGITREIWEDRKIHTLHRYYGADMPARLPAGVVVGNRNVIGATMATLAEFPDRTLLGEDVIWCGDEDDGFLSSHRLFSNATHTQDGQYGRATGKRLAYRVIADCAVKDNVIYDEWLVRDQGAIVRQMGWEPREFAANLIAREGGPERCIKPMTPDNDVPAVYTGRGNDNEWGAAYADILQRIMGAELSVVEERYDRACQVELPGGITGHGTTVADRFWLGVRAAFPSATFSVHHVIGREDPRQPPRAAVRWSLWGKHDGWGAFGAPSGADVFVLGMSHAEFGPRGLCREYVLFDETAIWKQIALATG